MATATKNNKNAPKLRALALAEVLARKKADTVDGGKCLKGCIACIVICILIYPIGCDFTMCNKFYMFNKYKR